MNNIKDNFNNDTKNNHFIKQTVRKLAESIRRETNKDINYTTALRIFKDLNVEITKINSPEENINNSSNLPLILNKENDHKNYELYLNEKNKHEHFLNLSLWNVLNNLNKDKFYLGETIIDIDNDSTNNLNTSDDSSVLLDLSKEKFNKNFIQGSVGSGKTIMIDNIIYQTTLPNKKNDYEVYLLNSNKNISNYHNWDNNSYDNINLVDLDTLKILLNNFKVKENKTTLIVIDEIIAYLDENKENTKFFNNLIKVSRSLGIKLIFSSQYDPNKINLTGLNDFNSIEVKSSYGFGNRIFIGIMEGNIFSPIMIGKEIINNS